MDQNIITLRYIIQAYYDSGRLKIIRFMDGCGGGKEMITFLKQGGEPIMTVCTPYLSNLVELQNTRRLEEDDILTNLVLQFVPPLPDDETNFMDFIGMRNIVVPDIRTVWFGITTVDLFSMPPSVSSQSVKKRSAYQMTPEYLAHEAAQE
jgi:hypothetical protein